MSKSITVTLTFDQAFNVAAALLTEARHQDEAAEVAAQVEHPAPEFAKLPQLLREGAEENRKLAEEIKRLAYLAGDKRYIAKTA